MSNHDDIGFTSSLKIYLAPLQGMTDRIFRNLFPLYFTGVDLAITPFISSSPKMRSGKSLFAEFHPDHNTGIPSIPQIMSSRPDDFAVLANFLFDLGYESVNWNLGCPFPMVVKKGRGSGMLCYPDRIEAFLDRAMPAVKPQLSIKLRLGLKDPDDIFELTPIFNRYPIKELIIHPRTGAQMYEGNVDLDRFEQCLKLSKHPVVYNGDIDSLEAFQTLRSRFPSVSRFMIGRGLLSDPFLAEAIRSGTDRPYDDKVLVLRAFHDDLLARYAERLSGPSHLINKMKEVWTYLGGFLENDDKLRKQIKKARHMDRYHDAVNAFFDDILPRNS